MDTTNIHGAGDIKISISMVGVWRDTIEVGAVMNNTISVPTPLLYHP